MDRSKARVAVYFAAFHLTPADSGGGEVAALPWDSVHIVNHAFWCVEPVDGPEISSFQRRAEGAGARKNFRLVPLRPEADLGDWGQSSLVPELPKNHFAQYAYFAPRHPDVRILLSIGGWTRSGFFSEMVYTPEGRASFIRCCLELLERYPWLGGIDIDWEYPAGTRLGERRPDPNDPDDQGCPIFGTPQEDQRNFAALLAELRAAMARVYGEGGKLLTACASGSVDWALSYQDWAAAAPSLDLVNIMTYDLAPAGIAGHASSAAQAEAAADWFLKLGVPPERICIGSPLYGSAFQLKESTRNPLGAPTESQRPQIGGIDQERLAAWQEDTRWQQGYDEADGGAYLYYDGADGPWQRVFVSYENQRSLQRKLDFVRTAGLGGIIVWEASQDTREHQMIRQMYEAFNR